MRLSLSLVVLASAFGTSAVAQTGDIVADITAALVANGCQMTEDEADPLLDPLGYPQDAVRDAVGALLEAGQATMEGDLLRLSDALCSQPAGTVPQPESPSLDVVIDTIRALGCQFTEPVLLAELEARGLSSEDLDALEPQVEMMVDLGDFVVDQDSGTFTLSEAICTGAAAPSVPRDVVIAAFAEYGCRMGRSEISFYSHVTRVHRRVFDRVLADLRDAGLVRENVEGDDVLDPAICTPVPIDPADPMTARLLSLFPTEGCEMPRFDLIDALAGAVEDRGEQDRIMLRQEILRHLGEISSDEGVLRLSDALCARIGGARPPPPATMSVDLILDIFRDNDCRLSQPVLIDALERRGLAEYDMAEVNPHLNLMIDLGEIMVNEVDETVTLSDAICREGAPPTDGRAMMIGLFAANGCTVLTRTVVGQFEDLGLTRSVFNDLLNGLIDEGLVTEGDRRFVLSDSVCTPPVFDPAEPLNAAILAQFPPGQCRFPLTGLVEALIDAGMEPRRALRHEWRVEALERMGHLRIVDGNIVLSAALCTPVEPVVVARLATAADADVSLIFDALRNAGCAASSEEVLAITEATGITGDRLRRLNPLFDLHGAAGNLILDPATDAVALGEAACAGAPLPTSRDVLANVLLEGGCDVAWPEVEAQAAVVGQTADQLTHALRLMQLLAEVEVTLAPPDSDTTAPVPSRVVLLSDACPAVASASPTDPRLALIAALGGLDCRAAFGSLPQASGLTPAELASLLPRMLAVGEVMRIEGEIVLAPSLCLPG